MKTLIQAIMNRPFDFSEEMFQGHCGLQALVRVSQDVERERQRRAKSQAHSVRQVSKMQRLTFVEA